MKKRSKGMAETKLIGTIVIVLINIIITSAKGPWQKQCTFSYSYKKNI